MPQENDVSTLLRMWTERTKKTQGEIAKLLDMSLDGYKKWLQGNLPHKRIPDAVRILKLSEEEETLLYEAVQHMAPRKNNLPPRSRLFTGRESYIERLNQYFKEDNCVALSGLGGIGKTQLALEYAHCRYKDKTYSAAFWVNAADQTTIASSCRELAEELNLPERDERRAERVIRAVKKWFAEHTNWLLVMDNVDDLQLANAFFPSVEQGYILLTTRSQFAGKIGVRQLDVDKMTLTEGIVFLSRRTDRETRNFSPDMVTPAFRKIATPLVQLLDGYPLALDQAGAFIEEAQVSIAMYIQLYEAQRRRLLDSHGATQDTDDNHPETIVVTFELCYQKVHERQPLATDILRFCAFLHSDTIPEELFQHDETFGVDTLAFSGGIAALRRYSLIKYNASEKSYSMHLRTLSMHRLVQAVLIDSMDNDLQKQWKGRVMRALSAAFPSASAIDAGKYERLAPHMLVCATWPEDEAITTVKTAELFRTASMLLLAEGRSAEAEMLRERALSILIRRLGTTHPATRTALNELASFYMARGEDDKADALYRQNLTIQDMHIEDDHPATAKCLRRWALLYLKRHEYEQAALLLERGVAIQETYLGTDHPDTGKTLCLLAILYYLQGKYSQAKPLYWRAIHIWDAHYVEERDVQIALDGDDLLSDEQPQHEQAIALYKRALDVEILLF